MNKKRCLALAVLGGLMPVCLLSTTMAAGKQPPLPVYKPVAPKAAITGPRPVTQAQAQKFASAAYPWQTPKQQQATGAQILKSRPKK